MSRAAVGIGLLTLVVLLSACIGVESNVSFRNDGSGTLRLEYRISKALIEMGKESGGETPLPFSEEELREAVEGNPKVELLEVSQREDEQDVYIVSEFGFDRIEDFAEIEEFDDMPMSLERAGGDSTFRMLISEGNGGDEPEEAEETDAELQAMFEQMFAGYEIIVVVNAPGPVKSHNLGELSSDSRTVRYSLPILELDALEEETTLTVVW
jgi:hypothetical protein